MRAASSPTEVPRWPQAAAPRSAHLQGSESSRERCLIIHLFTSGGLYLSSLGGATLMTHVKFEVIAKLIWCTRVCGQQQQKHTAVSFVCWGFRLYHTTHVRRNGGFPGGGGWARTKKTIRCMTHLETAVFFIYLNALNGQRWLVRPPAPIAVVGVFVPRPESRAG